MDLTTLPQGVRNNLFNFLEWNDRLSVRCTSKALCSQIDALQLEVGLSTTGNEISRRMVYCPQPPSLKERAIHHVASHRFSCDRLRILFVMSWCLTTSKWYLPVISLLALELIFEAANFLPLRSVASRLQKWTQAIQKDIRLIESDLITLKESLAKEYDASNTPQKQQN